MRDRIATRQRARQAKGIKDFTKLKDENVTDKIDDIPN